MKYYMKSKIFKIKEDFWIKNEYDEEVFFVDNKFLTLGLQFDMIKNGETLYSVKERLLAFMGKYEVMKENKVVANINRKFTFFKDKLDVDCEYGNLCIKGNIFDYNYKIYKDREVIATISKEFFSFTDNYKVDINFEDEAFILTLVVIIDDVIDKQRNNN